MERPELVIFDCDGVLVDSEPISNEVLARCLTRAGLQTSTSEALRDYKGRLLAEVVALAEERLGRALPDGFLEQFETEREAEFRRRLKPTPGAAKVVAKLRAAGIQVCVASQGRLTKSELTLQITGLRKLFDQDAVFSAYSVPRGKPHPDLFLHAAASMGVAPRHCLVVEDTIIGGAAALAAGMEAVAFDPAGEHEGAWPVGVRVVAALDEVLGSG